MAQKYAEITDKLADFIQQQKIFFVGTAARDGTVNVSPKGMDTLRVLNKNRLVWLNLTGSGNETAAHLKECDRITIMFCAFAGNPTILRLYGNATVLHPRDKLWNQLIGLFPSIPGARQIIDVTVAMAQTSCGMGVPGFDFIGERDHLGQWAKKRGEQGIRQYWEEKNQTSLDGKPTGIIKE